MTTPLYLTRIEIKNFRKIKDLTIEFTAPNGEPSMYHVIAGPNGCGKTTVLEAILHGLEKERTSGLRARRKYNYGTTDDTNTLELSLFWRDQNSMVELRRRTPERKIEQDDLALALYLTLAGMTTEHNADTATCDLAYFPSERIPDAQGSARLVLRRKEFRSEDGRPIETFLRRVRDQTTRRVPGYRGPEPRDVDWMSALNRFWRGFRDDGTELVVTLVDPANLDNNEWDLFLYLGDERVCCVDELSSGELMILNMVVPFITAEFEGLVLIDEPELHLHPEWQLTLMPALRAMLPTSQFIIATHSDILWDQAYSWERTLLVPEDDPRRPRRPSDSEPDEGEDSSDSGGAP